MAEDNRNIMGFPDDLCDLMLMVRIPHGEKTRDRNRFQPVQKGAQIRLQ